MQADSKIQFTTIQSQLLIRFTIDKFEKKGEPAKHLFQKKTTCWIVFLTFPLGWHTFKFQKYKIFKVSSARINNADYIREQLYRNRKFYFLLLVKNESCCIINGILKQVKRENEMQLKIFFYLLCPLELFFWDSMCTPDSAMSSST